jgi:hypothetical protein
MNKIHIKCDTEWQKDSKHSWNLDVGNIQANLRKEGGEWFLNCPIFGGDDILLEGITEKDSAKTSAEKKVYEGLVLLRDEFNTALQSFHEERVETRFIDGIAVTTSSTWSR